MSKRLAPRFISCLALAALLGGAAAPAATAAELKMAWSQDATGLDPHKQTAFSSIHLLELIYEPLVRLDSQLQIVPAIAQSWQFNADGTKLTFKLDPKAKFQNGSPVTAADVKASFERILNEATGAAVRANFLSIASIETPDDKTVVFNLSQPDVPILTAMTSINAAVLPDETAILAALRAKQVDFALLNDPLVATLVPKEPTLTLTRTPVLAYHVLPLNPSRKPMTELGVRQALSCAIDRKDVLDTALIGEGQVTGPLTMPLYRTDPSQLFCYKRDVAKAKKLLADAGHPDGFSAEVIVASGEPATAAAEAQVIQSQLAEIGVKLNIKVMELNVYVDRWLKGDFDMAVAINGGSADPYTMYNRYFTKTGNLQKVANYIDDTLDSLMQKGRVETNPAKRKDIFVAFEKHLAEVSPWIWLYTSYGYTAEQKTVDGFEPTPTGSLFGLARVSLKP